MGRSYKEAAKYEDKPQQVKNREQRNLARKIEVKAGKVSKGDGKDVDHIKPLSKGGKTTDDNIRVVREGDNRSFHRNFKHEWVGPKDSLAAQHITGKVTQE